MAFLLTTGAAAADGGAACAPAPPRFAPAAERTLLLETDDGTIAATFAGPQAGCPEALALMLHGYTGARDELPTADGEGMFARAARGLAARGVASLRIDFIGSGQSAGAWADTTFATQARDARRARERLAAMPGHEGLAVAALGYSQGGVAALLAARDGGFDGLALWNPVLAPRETYRTIFGDALDQALDAVRAGGADGSGPDGGGAVVPGTGLRPGFLAGVAAADPAADAEAFPGPLLVVAGSEDRLAGDGPARAKAIAAQRMAPTHVASVAAGHDLGARSDLPLFDAVVACTAGFLLGLAPR